MIDKSRIKEVAIKSTKEKWMRNGEYTESVTRFIDGIEWFKQNLWHDASEKPDEYEHIITEYTYEEDGNLCYSVDVFSTTMLSWSLYSKTNNIKRWCYLSDILPKGGEE